MKPESDILTECFVDTLMAHTILFPKKDYNHQKGCNNVLKRIREKFANKAAFGIIDDDKIMPNFHAFSLLKKHNEHLSIYKHTDKPHYIIKISKDVEDFILHCAEQCNISLVDYNLPTDFIKLKSLTKKTISLKDNNLKRLFFAFKQNEASDLSKIAQWINLFKTNPYDLDAELL